MLPISCSAGLCYHHHQQLLGGWAKAGAGPTDTQPIWLPPWTSQGLCPKCVAAGSQNMLLSCLLGVVP